ncbi:MAG: hypothetical protein LBF49_02940 [Puniceicoccales bacterium]|jgi:hypothetical protein|nr:hypothetical protein [Puniceicoccales bacterium]
MSFGIGREIYFGIGNSITLGEVTFPPGEFSLFNSIVSFQPKGGQKIFRYKTDGEGNIVKRRINDRWVSLEDWEKEIAKDKGLRNSNFGKKPLCGGTGFAFRKTSVPDLID